MKHVGYGMRVVQKTLTRNRVPLQAGICTRSSGKGEYVVLTLQNCRVYRYEMLTELTELSGVGSSWVDTPDG